MKPTGGLGAYKAKGRQNKRNAAMGWAGMLVREEKEREIPADIEAEEED